MADSTYWAFANAMQLPVAARGEAGLRADLGEFQALAPIQNEITRNQISGSFESRGLFHSGEHEKALAQQRAQEQASMAGATSKTAAGISDLEAQLAARILGG